MLLTSVTSIVLTSNLSGAITTGSTVENANAEDSPQNAHRAEDVSTRAAQNQTQKLHDVHLKAKATRERIAATAIGTRKRERKRRKTRKGERDRGSNRSANINTPNTLTLNTSSPHDMLSMLQ